ncbi:hypothetical protein BSKO_06648 [Bryopsis sp. KO-2023]|nr:hypothetical protein BSKO_06648 [Bryopsis sp. KO-2023]
MAVYTDQYSGIRVADAQLCAEDLKRMVVDFCVFKVDNVRYHSMKGKDVVVIGVVIKSAPFDETKGSVVISLWGFERRKCLAILKKETAAAAGPLKNGTVVILVKPKVVFHDEKMYLSVREISIIGKSKDYGVCSHSAQDGTSCEMVIDCQRGPLCSEHSKARLLKIQTAQALRPELKGSWAGWRQTYGREYKGVGKRKSRGGEIDIERRSKKISKQKLPTEKKQKDKEEGEKQQNENKSPLPASTSEVTPPATQDEVTLPETANEPNTSGSDDLLPASQSEPPIAVTDHEAPLPAAQSEDPGWIVLEGYETDQDSYEYWKKEEPGVDEATSAKEASTKKETKPPPKAKPMFPRPAAKNQRGMGISSRQVRARRKKIVANMKYSLPLENEDDSDSSSS